MEWIAVVQQIRSVDGFHSFLRPPSYSELRAAAEGGPVIIVNISRHRSDAIVVRSSDPPILIPLPRASPAAITQLADRLGSHPEDLHDSDAVEFLREIWRLIVGPVAEQLKAARLPLGARIWWCPTGAAARLPLHAAGPYNKGERDLVHLYVSSYTPTLGALIRARRNRGSPSPRPPAADILVICQPETPNEERLAHARDELTIVQTYAPDATVLEGDAGTQNAVLEGIASHSWVHLACHGHHVPTQPFLSRFALHDGPLTLMDLIQRNLPNAELAVLSACHSATVSRDFPDEALHPAACLLFAGFRGVVATMWALEDQVGPLTMETFYKEMVGSGPKDCNHAAHALKKASQLLGKRQIPLMQRINFVHFGI